MDTLKLIEIAQRFQIKKENDDYIINHNNEELMAIIDKKGDISFYVTGVYNSGSDIAQINMNALKELQEFCKLIIEREEME